MRSEFFQALLRSLQDGVVVIDERGTIELINPGLERFLGYMSHPVPVDAFVALVRAQRPLPPNTRVKPA